MTIRKTIEELEALVSGMEAQIQTAQAKAAELCLHREPGQSAIYVRKAERGQHYVEVIRRAVVLLKAREKTGAFVPPTFPELAEYCGTAFPTWPKADYLSWWNHFEACGWVIGKSKKMVDWKRAAANGFKNWQDKNGTRAAASVKSEDPDGWKEFLRKKGRPYGSYKYAAEFLRDEFQKGRK